MILPTESPPAVTATHDGTTLTVGVSEAGTPRGGTARGGDFVAQDDGPGAIAGWAGTRFGRGEDAAEYLVVYTDAGPPEAMTFIPENLNRLNEVSGLTGESVPESGLAIETAWLPVIASTSLAAAGPRGSVTYGPTGTGQDQGLAFTGTFAGGSGEYRCSGGACSLTLDDRGVPTAMGGAWTFAPAPGAMVLIPDYDQLHFGWWLNEEEDGSYGFQTFAGGVGLSLRRRQCHGRHGGLRDLPGRCGRRLRDDGRLRGAGDGSGERRVHRTGDARGPLLRCPGRRRGHRHHRLLQERERGADDGLGRGAEGRRPDRWRCLLRRRHRGNARPRDEWRRQLGGAVSRDRRPPPEPTPGRATRPGGSTPTSPARTSRGRSAQASSRRALAHPLRNHSRVASFVRNV